MRLSQKQKGYIVAILAAVLLLALRSTLSEPLNEQALFLPFVLAVIAAAWWGGLGPGLVATALGLLLGVFFLVPPLVSTSADRIAIALGGFIFIIIGATVSVLCEALHAARRRDTEMQFHTLADSIPQLVWMARADGHRFWFNKQWYDYTGATAKETHGWGWQSFHDPAELPDTLKSWRASLHTGKPWENTFRLRRHDGQMRWQLARARPVRDEHGDIVCWFGTNTDVMERLESEQALKDAHRRKDEFLATLAHELRNPLAPISNALQLWPMVHEDEAEMEHLRLVMSRQVQQITRLIDDLMDVSRINRGKIVLRRQPVDINALVAKSVEENQPLIDAHGHELIIVSPGQPIIVDGDGARLTQVLANLLNNAAKYTPRHGTIRIETSVEGDRVSVSIRDNGPGIPEQMLSSIFEMFQQVDNSLERSHGGLGIGLTLVKQLVELHGGTVEAHSEGPGKGSQFVVKLPLSARRLENVQPPDSSHSKMRAAPTPSRRILVVDDYEASGETLAAVLQFLGHQATALSRPAAALEYLEENKPDIIIIDIAMPGMNGYDVARRIRQNPRFHDVYLVALTGHGQPKDRQAAFDAGFNHHIAKPASMEALEKLLSTFEHWSAAAVQSADQTLMGTQMSPLVAGERTAG
jgi:PAS domain S-box-containing protein